MLPLLVAVVSFGAFSRSLQNEFVNLDDIVMLADNSAYRGLGPAQIRWMFTTFHTGPYQPLSWLSYAVDHAIWGMQPRGFHLTNLLLHTATAVAFYFLSMRLLKLGITGAVAPNTIRFAAAVSALLFSIHPLRVESVAWATERRDVLSGLFYMTTAIAYLRYVAAQAPARRWWYAFTLALFVSCLLAKAMAVTLPVVLLVVDVYPLGRLGGRAGWIRGPARKVLIEKLPLLLISLVVGIVAVVGQHTSGAMADVERFPFVVRLGIAAYAAGFYLLKTALPFGLAPMYEFTRPYAPWIPYMALAAVGLLCITAVVFALRRRCPALPAAWVAYLVTLAPVSGLLQSGVQVAADRYTYLPMLGFNVLAGAAAIGLITSVAEVDRKRRQVFVAIASSVIVVALVALTIRQTGFWRNSEQVWIRVLAVDPASPMGNTNLGIYYHFRGQHAAALNFAMAGATAKPENSDSQLVCARVLKELGRPDEASQFYRRAATGPAPTVEALGEYGLLLARRGEFERAEQFLQQTVGRQPTHAEAQAMLGLVAASRGDLAEMQSRFDLAMTAPTAPAYLFITISRAFERVGKSAEARIAVERGLARYPEDSTLIEAIKSFGPHVR